MGINFTSYRIGPWFNYPRDTRMISSAKQSPDKCTLLTRNIKFKKKKHQKAGKGTQEGQKENKKGNRDMANIQPA